MRFALLLLVAVSAFGEVARWPAGQADRALEANVREIIGGPAIAIKDSTLLCSDGECVVFRANGSGALTIAPVVDKSVMAAVRRYWIARTSTPQDADASTCATGEAQVGDACDVQDSGLLFMLGSTR